MVFHLTSGSLNRYFQQFQQLQIAVIGDLMLDQYLQGSVERISPEGPVPIVHVQSETSRPGGAANVAVNLLKLGAQCRLVGLSGQDRQRGALIDCLAAAGIDPAGVVADPHGTTVIKTRVLARQQQLLRIDHEEPAAAQAGRSKGAVEKRLTRLALQAVAGADAVILSDYLKGCLTADLIRQVIAAATGLGIPVLVDSKDSTMGRYRGATWIKPNRKEAARVVGFDLVTEADFTRAAKVFIQHTGCQVVAITRSSKGISIFERTSGSSRARRRAAARTTLRRLDSPTHALEVFDVTGGGDTAIAVMALMASLRAPLEDTIELANLASGVTVSRVGTYGPTPREIMELFAQHTVSDETGKLITAEQAVALFSRYRTAGKKIVFTNGCFDIFHAGHVQTLQYARSQGHLLVVAINSDASVRRQCKAPDRPLVEEFARAMVLSSLACVDHVIVYEEDTPVPLLMQLKPDVLVKGGDYGKEQVVGWQIVEGYGGKVVVAPFVDGLSTTRLVAKIRSSKAVFG